MEPSVAVAAEVRPVVEIVDGSFVRLYLPRWMTAIAVTDPTVVSAQPGRSGDVVDLYGRRPGSTDVIVQFGSDVPLLEVDLAVTRDVRLLQRTVDGLVDPALPPAPLPVPHVPASMAKPVPVAVQGAVVVDLPPVLASSTTVARVADEGVAGVRWNGDELVLSGVREGWTTLVLQGTRYPRDVFLVGVEVTAPR